MDRNEEATSEVVMSQSAHDAIVEKTSKEAAAKAQAEGVAEGRKAAHDRLSAILGDEKVKGKIDTAIDLALRSPDMKAEDVVAFVAKLPAGASAVPSIESRMNGQGVDLALGMPLKQDGSSENVWDASIAKVNEQYGVPSKR